LKKLFQEMHTRSLWQVLGLYAAGSWIGLQVLDVLTQNVGLPAWVFRLALGLLALGLPVVVLTALAQGLGRKGRDETTEGAVAGSADRRGLFTWRNALYSGVAAAILWTGVAVGWLLFGRGPDPAATIDAVTGLAEVQELVGANRFAEAYARARALDPAITDDSLRGELWEAASDLGSVTSSPPGAEVWTRAYDSTEDDWEYLGRTPLEQVRLPLGFARLRLELEGYQTLLVAKRARWENDLVLLPEDDVSDGPSGMVHIAGADVEVFLPGLEHLAIQLPEYFIDKYELTSRQFKSFVDSGGYSDRRYWEHPFVLEGPEISFDEAMARFVDRTGRPGPASWEVGSYSDGTADHPVGGISWYEAEAYGRFVGKQVPTVYHWYWAAFPHAGEYMLPRSNLEGEGPAPVGTFDGMSPFGVWDAAGNVREWTYNRTEDKRFILGGAWDDPEYMFTDANAQDPFDRSEANGFRLMVTRDTTNLALAQEPIVRPHRDYFAETPVPEEIFDVYRRMYAYDETPLAAEVVARESTPHWTRETVELDAAYGDERFQLYLYLPSDAEPPYQTIVYFPGSGVIYRDASPAAADFPDPYLIRSGRAVAFPVYKGTLERGTDLSSDIQNETNSYREHVIQWYRDLGRSIDYLETRPDISQDGFGYVGMSWGSAIAPIMLALDDRLEASVLLSGGLVLQPTQPEVDPFNFLPRVTAPTRMINVPTDYFYPLETSQKPFYEFLAAEPKDSVLVEGGHRPPMNVVAREALDWLDRYLGPVR
jgi:dienelactone hydrolase